MKTTSDRFGATGVVVIALSLLSLLMLLVSAHQQRVTAECQSRVNAVFLETLKERAALSDRFNDNVDRLVISVFTVQTVEEKLDAYALYKKNAISTSLPVTTLSTQNTKTCVNRER